MTKGTARSRADPGLERFVAAGAPPVYVGFGSSVGPDPARVGAAVRGAVRQAGVRAVIASGWGGLSGVRDDSDVLVMESAPHRWLFPVLPPSSITEGRGRPRSACSRHVRPLSARSRATSTSGARLCTAPALARSRCRRTSSPLRVLRRRSAALDDSAMHARTAELSERIAQEDGAARASEQIESTLT